MARHSLQEDEELNKLVKSRCTETKLNLSKCNLRFFPEVYPLTLKQVHLKGNKLTRIPGSIFTDLPHLVWLDVRNNEIRELPPQVQCADSLEDLLLGGNLLLQLPACLANLKSLTGLQLQPNPMLRSPPKDIVEKGIKAIMKYLSETVDELKSPKEATEVVDEEIEKYYAPDRSTQNRILELSLKNPLSFNQYKEAMEKHLAEQKVPIHLKKWESMTEEDKVDRTIKNAAIQHELQRVNDEIERQKFRHRGPVVGAEQIGDSQEIDLVLNHAKNLTLGVGNPAQLTSNEPNLYQNNQGNSSA